MSMLLKNIFVLILITHYSNADDDQVLEKKFWLNPEPPIDRNPSNDECVRRIYSDCNYPTVFTDEELENVRQFLNYSFTQLADIKPDKPLCPKLHVRHDWKCLSPQQKTRIVNVWKVLYRRGVIQALTDLHVKWWPTWHKSAELLGSHRWFCNEFEKAMRAVDPQSFLPYWNPHLYGVQPERASIWRTLGHSGNYSNGYAVPDGLYSELGLFPTIKRHWTPRGTIYPWFTPEVMTYIIQIAQGWNDFQSTLGLHFMPHLSIGGYEGQYAVREAPYDILFFLHHTSTMDNDMFRWQLLRSENLTPLSYNWPGPFKINEMNKKIEQVNILTDTLSGAPGVTIRELFWYGFGDMCFIPDQYIRPINNLWKGMRDPIPTAAKRLPQWISKQYFPYFASGNFSAFTHILEEVGNCNTICHPMPKPVFMRETEIGRRQFEAYRNDEGPDTSSAIEAAERSLIQLWSDLNSSGYCSPYVTTY